MMRNMMNSPDPGVMAENARTLRNQGQPEDMALRMAARQSMGPGMGGMQTEVMPHGEMLGAGAAMGGDGGMTPGPDPNAAQGNAPAIAIPGAGNPPPPGMGMSGGSDPNDPNVAQQSPQMSQWIQQLIGRLGQGGSMSAQPGYQTQGGMSTLAGMIGKR